MSSRRNLPGSTNADAGTPEHPRRGVAYEPTYTQSTASLPAPGEFPFVRGVYASMYTERPWTLRQYAGFASASESNGILSCLSSGGTTRVERRLRSADPPWLR